MSFIKYRFSSNVLRMDTEVNVILPDSQLKQGRRYPVLYLLHGAGGDCDSWMRNSSIERYAKKQELAVVMPSAYNSCYADMVYGMPYFTFLSEELPHRLENLLPVADEPENRFVAGLSMGGRGAFLWAMRRPDFFKGAACLSGSLDIAAMAERMKAEGDQSALKRFHSAFPKFLYMCGLEDERYEEQFLPFLSYCKEIGLPMDSLDGHGIHDFDYWDWAIQQAIVWMKHLE